MALPIYDWNDIKTVDDDVQRTPIEKKYFTGEMLSKYEPCTEALKVLVESEGKDEDAWDTFEECFEKFLNFTWCSNWEGKKYDLIFYGVSGYTGYLMMQYLKRTALKKNPEEFTFAFAGRTRSKVQDMRDRNFMGTEWEDTPILEASYDDVVSVMDMCRSASVIINVAGPYMLSQGDILIDACCRLGVHYCDVSGEIPWSLRTLNAQEQAKQGGALICPSSAVAGAFPDILTYTMAKRMREQFGEELKIAHVFVAGGGAAAGASGGTLATRAAMSNAGDDVRKAMADVFGLGGFIPLMDRNGFKEATIQKGTGRVTLKARKEENDAVLNKMALCPNTGFFRAPHMYAFFDTRTVRRTNALLADFCGTPYGSRFIYQQFGLLPPDVQHQLSAQQGRPNPWGDKLEYFFPGGVMPPPPTPEEAPQASEQAPPAEEKGDAPKLAAPAAMKDQAAEMELLQQQGKYFKQGDGPALEELHDAWLALFGWAETVNGNVTRLSCVGKDGYFETARMAVEMAMTMRFDYDKLPIKGGHLTAAAAGQQYFFNRIIQSGLKFNPNDWIKPVDHTPPPY